MWANILMLAGGATWLAGELYGVVSGSKGLPATTSGWVWLAEKKWKFSRIFVALGLVTLGSHFLFHIP